MSNPTRTGLNILILDGSYCRTCLDPICGLDHERNTGLIICADGGGARSYCHLKLIWEILIKENHRIHPGLRGVAVVGPRKGKNGGEIDSVSNLREGMALRIKLVQGELII